MSKLGDSVYMRNSKALWRRTGDGVVVRLRDRQPGTISGTGELLWDLLEEGQTCRQLATRLALIHDVPVEQVEKDIERVIDELESVGLVVRCRPRGPRK